MGAVRLTWRVRLISQHWSFLRPSFLPSPTLFSPKVFPFSPSVSPSPLNLHDSTFSLYNFHNFAFATFLGLTYLAVSPGGWLYLCTTVLITLLCKSFVLDCELFERRAVTCMSLSFQFLTNTGSHLYEVLSECFVSE